MNNKLLIGITGCARSGKDTAADYIMHFYPEMAKMSFADPLKNMIRVGLGLSDEQLYGDEKEIVDPRYGQSPRHIMQTLGTEWGRQLIDPDLWLKTMDLYIQPFTIIPDVRFENEAQYIRDREGMIIHIVGREKVIEGDHISENPLNIHDGDRFVRNNGSLESLYDQLKELI